jgi:hypothetical protein
MNVRIVCCLLGALALSVGDSPPTEREQPTARVQNQPANPAQTVTARERGVRLDSAEIKQLQDLRRDAIGDLMHIASLKEQPPTSAERQGVSKDRVSVDAKRAALSRRLHKVFAIQLLGEWRAEEACHLVVREIELTEPLLAFGRRPLDAYPAAQALAEIGSPAANEILVRLRRPANDRELLLFAWVIYLIDGKELGQARLKIAASRPQTQIAKENLSRLMDLFNRVNFKDPDEWPSRRLAEAAAG